MAKCLAIIFLQTAYVMYIVYARPHSEDIFNYLEIWNEGLIIMMCYLMLIYTGMGSQDQSFEVLKIKSPQIVSLVVTFLIILANVGVLVRMTLRKAKQKKAERRQKKALKVREILMGRIKKYRLEDMPIEHRMKPLSLIPELPVPEASFQEQQRLETYSDHESDDTRATMFRLRETYMRSGRKIQLPNHQRAFFQR